MRHPPRPRPAGLRVAAALVACAVLAFPLPAAQVAAFPTGDAIDSFHDEVAGTDSDYALVYGENIAVNFFGQPSGQYYPLGFKMPVDAFAADMSFDLTSVPGYKWHMDYFKAGGSFSPGKGEIHANTTSQFDLRYGLNYASPFAFPDPASRPLDGFNTSGSAVSVAVGDFDGDTTLDIAVLTDAAIEVHFQRGGNFTQNVSYPITGTPIRIFAQDLNGDGTTDILAGTRTTTQLVLVYPILQLASGALRSEGAQTVMTGAASVPNGMAVGDLTGDGRPEVAFIFGNRNVRWAEQFGGRNVDTWSTDVYTVDRQSANFNPRPNAVAVAGANCTSVAAVGQTNGSIAVLNQNNMNQLATLTNHTSQVNGLAYSPTCSYLASVGSDGRLNIWIATTNALAGATVAHSGPAYAAAFSPDGTRVATGGNSEIKVWNLTPLPSPFTLERSITETNGSVLALEYSPDGTVLAAATTNGTVRLYETAGYTLVGNLTAHAEGVRSVSFHPSGALLASGSEDDKVVVWDVANQTELLNYTHASGNVLRVRFSPNGTLLATASADGHLRVYRTDTWSFTDDIDAGNPFYSFDFGPQSASLFGAAGPGNPTNVRVWDKARLLPIAGWQTRQEFSVLSVEYGAGASLAAAASEDGTVVVINSTTGAQVARLFAHNGTANSVAWSPSGSFLATSGSDGLVQVFSTSGYSAVTNLTLAGNLSTVRFSPDSSLIAAGSSTGNVSVWWTSNWTQAKVFNASNRSVNSLAFDPTGTLLVVGAAANSTNETVAVFDALGGARTLTLPGITYPVRAVDWSPDGATIAAAGNGTNLYMWNATGGSLVSNQVAHTSSITAVAFSPDSLRVASGGLDRLIHTWSVATGLRVQTVSALPPTANEVRSVDWSPDGRRLVVGWNDYRFPVTRQYNASASGSGWAVAIGNVDGNAGNDLVVLVEGGFSSAVQYTGFSGGNPTGWFSTGGGSDPFDGARQLAIGDLDGDGAQDDIVVVSAMAGGGNAYFQQHNSSNQWNQVIHSVFIGQDTTSIVVADVTDDGRDDVILAVGLTNQVNDLVVLAWDPNARDPVHAASNMGFQTVSRYDLPAVATSPSAVAAGDLDGDGLTDAVTANGATRGVSVFHQLDTLQGRYISPPLENQQLPNLPIVSAYLEYDEVQSPPDTRLEFFVSVNNGLTWTPVTRNETVNFGPADGTKLRFRVDFFSDRAGITGIVQQLWAHYLIQSVGLNPRIDVGNDAILDWNVSGTVAGTTRVTVPGVVVNGYVSSHLFLTDANGTIQVPFTIRWQRPGGYNLTNLSVPFNSRPPAPVLIAPPSGGYASAQPDLQVTSYDPDGEPLKYHLQVSLTDDFLNVLFEYDQNFSNVAFACFICLPGAPAGKVVEDDDRLVSGTKYYWRARAWDGQQWSVWSPVWNFTVDDQPPEGAASSPKYTTVLEFTVSWSAVDPPGGSGLAARPYDVQWKDGLNGTWTDWHLTTNATSAVFSPAEEGHTYCFRMRSVDVAGNEQIYLTNTAGDTCTSVDTGRPSASMLPLDDYQVSAAFTVRWVGDDGPSGSGVANFDIEYKENDGPWMDGPQAYASTQWTFIAQNDSAYCFRVAPRDRAGNLGDPANPPACTTVDTSPPGGSVIIPDTTTNLTCVNVSWAFSDPQTGIVGYEYSVGTSPGGANVLAPTSTPTPVSRICGLTLANEGTYHVNVRALNGAGGWSPWVPSNPMRVVIPGPVTTLEYPTGIWTQLNVTLSIGIRDPLGFDLVVGDLQFRRAAFRDNAILPWDDWRTVPVAAGPMDFVFEGLIRGYAYEFKYRARNDVGSWGAYNGSGTLIVNQLPVAATGGDRRVNISEAVVLDASATIDYDGARDTLTFTWEADDGQVISGPTGRISFDRPGVHLILLKVDDTHEVAIAEVYVYVKEPEPKQVLPGFGGVLALLGLVAAVALAGERARRRRRA